VFPPREAAEGLLEFEDTPVPLNAYRVDGVLLGIGVDPESDSRQ